MKKSKMQENWYIVLLRMVRFFSEGYTTWSKKNFYLQMEGEEFATDAYIKGELKRLECNGVIRVIGEDDKYIEILNYDKLVAAKNIALQSVDMKNTLDS